MFSSDFPSRDESFVLGRASVSVFSDFADFGPGWLYTVFFVGLMAYFSTLMASKIGSKCVIIIRLTITIPVDDQNQKPRKPKTEAQKARERERRKRRRQNKQKKLALAPGSDVPKILGSEGGEAAALAPAPDLESVEEAISPQAEESLQPVEEMPPEPVEALAPVEPPQAEESLQPLEEMPPEPEESLEPLIDDSQRIFEQGVVDSQPQSTSENGLYVETDGVSQTAVEDDEEERARRQREEAEKISTSLLSEDEMLVEVPQKQGLLGKLFDSLEKISEKRRAKKMSAEGGAPSESGEVLQDPLNINVEAAQLATGPSFLGSLLKWFLRLVILAALVVAAFWAGSSLKVLDFFNQMWKPLPPGLELYVATDGQVLIDPQMQQKLGFETARLAGANLGNAADLTYNVFFNANYFGRLLDPVSVSETGISAAIYYGFGRDNEYMRNRFVFYVQFLAKLRNSNQVRISDLLDGKVRRDLALDGFIEETEALFDEGNTYRKEIAVQVDDLKIAVNSINPDKDRYENDFFLALDATNAEKADVLIQSFVEITQKQVDLKAKLAALTQLYQYYENALVEMKTRLEAVKKNREALIGGVEVVETPGVDLGLIRQQ